MINVNFKHLAGIGLQSEASGVGMVSVTNVSNLVSYAAPTFAFPLASRTSTIATSATAAGISIGSGGTEESDTDINLEETITTGFTGSITGSRTGTSAGTGNPYLEYDISITNSGTDTLTVREIGYKQSIATAPYISSASRSNTVCLVDRTTLDPALEIPAGEARMLTYRLWTNLYEERRVNGIKMVSWEWGSDEDITTMIEAAHEGTIDLQEDAKWMIGMKRPIKISAFTGGGNVSHAEQTIDLVITSFEDYNNCGCVMQVDFDEALAAGQRMNATNTNAGGYSATEMYTTTLPALLEALPEYIQGMMVEFSVKARAGSNSTEIETIVGNKLALRSHNELNGAGAAPYTEEGTLLDYYRMIKAKRIGRAGSTNTYWGRSPSNSTTQFVGIKNDGTAAGTNASTALGLAPFFCV